MDMLTLHEGDRVDGQVVDLGFVVDRDEGNFWMEGDRVRMCDLDVRISAMQHKRDERIIANKLLNLLENDVLVVLVHCGNSARRRAAKDNVGIPRRFQDTWGGAGCIAPVYSYDLIKAQRRIRLLEVAFRKQYAVSR